MQIQELPTIKKRIQRIGRSGKRGSYSGRGVKGQKSRSGRRLRPAERDIILRIPKRRGFRNMPKFEKGEVLNLGELSRVLKPFVKSGAVLEVDLTLLKAAGLLPKGFKGMVKILSNGEMAFPVRIKGATASKGATAKIEKAGGSIVK